MPTSSDSNDPDLKVFISHRDAKCDDCGDELGRQAWITLDENKGVWFALILMNGLCSNRRCSFNETRPKAFCTFSGRSKIQAQRQREGSTELDRTYVQEFARREFKNSFRTVPKDEKSKSLNTLVTNTAGVLADRRRLRVSTNALYCWQWLPMCAIVKQITTNFWQS